VRDAVAFLAAATTRLAINVTQSARARRETHIGTWLPEPDFEADLAHSAERAEALDRAVLVLLENLSPIERAAYVLREAFEYPYRQISKVLAISEANARQLAARARLHLAGERRRQVSAAQPSDSSTRSSTPPRLEISPRSKGCSPPMSSRASLARLRHSPATARPGSATRMARHIVYPLCRRDRATPPATQRFVPKRASARITSVHFSHASPVYPARAATRLILQGAAQAR
jgi:hypothetical protein